MPADTTVAFGSRNSPIARLFKLLRLLSSYHHSQFDCHVVRDQERRIQGGYQGPAHGRVRNRRCYLYCNHLGRTDCWLVGWLAGTDEPGQSSVAVPECHWVKGNSVEVSVQNQDKKWVWAHAVVAFVKNRSTAGTVDLHVIPSSGIDKQRVTIATNDKRLAPIATYLKGYEAFRNHVDIVGDQGASSCSGATATAAGTGTTGSAGSSLDKNKNLS